MFPKTSGKTLQMPMFAAVSLHLHFLPFPYPTTLRNMRPWNLKTRSWTLHICTSRHLCDATPHKLLDEFCCLMSHFEDKSECYKFMKFFLLVYRFIWFLGLWKTIFRFFSENFDIFCSKTCYNEKFKVSVQKSKDKITINRTKKIFVCFY